MEILVGVDELYQGQFPRCTTLIYVLFHCCLWNILCKGCYVLYTPRLNSFIFFKFWFGSGDYFVFLLVLSKLATFNFFLNKDKHHLLISAQCN